MFNLCASMVFEKYFYPIRPVTLRRWSPPNGTTKMRASILSNISKTCSSKWAQYGSLKILDRFSSTFAPPFEFHWCSSSLLSLPKFAKLKISQKGKFSLVKTLFSIFCQINAYFECASYSYKVILAKNPVGSLSNMINRKFGKT